MVTGQAKIAGTQERLRRIQEDFEKEVQDTKREQGKKLGKLVQKLRDTKMQLEQNRKELERFEAEKQKSEAEARSAGNVTMSPRVSVLVSPRGGPEDTTSLVQHDATKQPNKNVTGADKGFEPVWNSLGTLMTVNPKQLATPKPAPNGPSTTGMAVKGLSTDALVRQIEDLETEIEKLLTQKKELQQHDDNLSKACEMLRSSKKKLCRKAHVPLNDAERFVRDALAQPQSSAEKPPEETEADRARADAKQLEKQLNGMEKQRQGLTKKLDLLTKEMDRKSETI